MEGFESLMAAVSAVGFPIVITFYVLIRLQASIDRMTKEVDRLVTVLEKNVRTN